MSKAPWPSTAGPSIFSADVRFKATGTGRSASEAASLGVDAYRASHGSCKNTIAGLSAKADKQELRWKKKQAALQLASDEN